MTRLIAALAAGLCLLATTAFAQDYEVGELKIMHPTIRATPPNAPVSAGYMTITNGGTEADRLLGGSADFAKKVEVHEMKMDGQVMKMRRMKGGLEIPPGGEVRLEPGGYHIMFMKLNEQIKVGETLKCTLEFEKAGSVEIEFSVEEIKPSGSMNRAGHGESSMIHSPLPATDIITAQR
jgi:copper(I)-binding protein